MNKASGYANILTGSTLRGNVLGLTGKGGSGYMTVAEEARRGAYTPMAGLGEFVAMNGLGRLVQRRAQPRVSGLGDYFTTSSQLRGMGGLGRAFGDLLDDLVSTVNPPEEPPPQPLTPLLSYKDPITGQTKLTDVVGQAECGPNQVWDGNAQACVNVAPAKTAGGGGGAAPPKPQPVGPMQPPPVKQASLLKNPLFWAGAAVVVGGGALLIAKSRKHGAASSGARMHANRRRHRRGSRRYRNNGATC